MTDDLDRLYERVLLLRCQTGDGSAFAELVARYQARLGGYLRRLLGEAAATDALQDVWLAVWRGLPGLRDPAAFPAWAFRVARDRAFRELRRQGVPTVPADESIPEAAADDDFTAEDAAEVRAALARLPVDHRDVLLLRFIEGLSYDEIAAVVGKPVGTVRSRIHYAKEAMRRQLEREGTR
ncbi:MAG TPA: sigma-70 family RNA polymerase sigma factor [Fimbriiglobus sp.]|nr:sigma-70 family RNA polymerase sigma factor [Fimbriiglobus sp.]